jgi:two-component system, OmpR family, phosphate regulon sensor histidine kinase PhoR
MIKRFLKKKDQTPRKEGTNLSTPLSGKDVETAEEIRSQRDELSTLVAGISDAILALDLDESPLFYNTQFAVLVGQELLNQGHSKLIEMIRDPDIVHAFRYSLNEGKTFHLKAVPHTQGDRKKFYSLSISPLKRPDRTVYGAVGIFHDVTELRNAEQIRIEFVANVSHELRTPLTAIKGYTDTLIEDVKSGRAVEKSFLEVIHRNTDRLMHLISDLLDLSAMDSGVDSLVKEKISTEELTNRLVGQLKKSLEAKNQTIEVRILASYVFADLKRIEQVLINLLDNASKYSPVGGKLLIEWRKENYSGDTLLEVRDEGPGIPSEHHDRLFERFYRVDKGRSRDTGGTGLGLAIVKNIMQRHGGAVWVESEIHRGSSFTCQFPFEGTGNP